MSAAVVSQGAGPIAGDRSRKGAITIVALVVVLVFACFVSLASGPTGVGLHELWLYFTGHADTMDARDRVILEAVRLPRTGLGLMIGAGLAVSGAMMQGLFRNPLADPGLIGITSGAALFAVAALALGAACWHRLRCYSGRISCR